MDIVKDKLVRVIRGLKREKDHEGSDKFDYMIADLEYIQHIVRPEPTEGQHFNTPRRKHG